MTIERIRDIIRNRAIVGVQPGTAGRLFVRCYQCRRVVPSWQLLKLTPEGRTGCKCGSMYVKPTHVEFWPAAWWLFVRGYLIRKWIQRREDFDPRIPYRQVAHGGS